LTACGTAGNDNNSIQFNGYSLTCRLNSTSANYKASTNATKKSKYTEKILNRQKTILHEN
jgi:hypothetical protein